MHGVVRTTLQRWFSLEKRKKSLAKQHHYFLEKIHIFSETFIKLLKLLWGHAVEIAITRIRGI